VPLVVADPVPKDVENVVKDVVKVVGDGNGKAKVHDKDKDGKHDGDVVVAATIAASPSASSPDAPVPSVSP
jgi:hypothetical protein